MASMDGPAASWGAQIRSGDVRAISRAITAVENGDAAVQSVLRDIFPSTGRAWRIGITGAAGVGKSTIADRLAAHYRAAGKTVGIVAVDPSSPFTGGAILGDRVRMQGHATDPGVFIRSMAARGAWGGLADAAADAALILDAAGKDVIFLETIGVGQDEVEVVRIADCTLVVVVPGAGDEVQSLKAGLMEIADIFVLNKSDLDGAAVFERELSSVIELGQSAQETRAKIVKTPIVKTTASEGKGIEKLAAEIDSLCARKCEPGQRRERETAYWRSRILHVIECRIMAQVAGNASRRLDELASSVASRAKDPYAAADEIVASLARFG